MKNKKVLSFIVVVIVILILASIYIIINNKKEKEDKNQSIQNNQSNVSNTSENIKLEELSLNGIKLGDKIQNNMKNQVFDAEYLYEYDNLCIDIDENDNINYLAFYTLEDNKDDKIKSIEDIIIKYDNKKIESIDDFKSILGNAKEEKDENGDYKIRYNNSNSELELYVKNNEIYNIVLKKK